MKLLFSGPIDGQVRGISGFIVIRPLRSIPDISGVSNHSLIFRKSEQVKLKPWLIPDISWTVVNLDDRMEGQGKINIAKYFRDQGPNNLNTKHFRNKSLSG
jgi:hypothetical protein